jgi:YD repeat-containing protein
VLTRTQTVLSVMVVTTYTYNAANQLVTAKSDNSPTVWHYAYDQNGSLTDVTPDGSPGSGALRYTCNAALQLVQVERHDDSDYELVSEMLYDGLGQRRQMTAWEGGLSATTTYAVDSQRGGAVLAAEPEALPRGLMPPDEVRAAVTAAGFEPALRASGHWPF